MSTWQTKKLGEICSFVRGPFGGSLKKSIFKKDGYAVYEQQHAIYDQFNDIRYFIDEKKFNEMKRFELKSNDLIMSCSGTMGKMAIVPQNIKKGIINQALLKLTPSNQILIKFLKSWMESEIFQDKLKLYSKGAAIKNVASVKILKDIEINLPLLSEQQRIVKILDEAFEKINKAKQIAEKNLQNSKDLFESYLQNIFVNSSNSWHKKKLGEICIDLLQGINTATDKTIFVNEGVPILQAKEIGRGKLELNKCKFITKESFENVTDRYKPKKGDILYNNIGSSLGRSIEVDWEFPFTIAWNVMRIIPNKNEISPKILNYVLQSPNIFKNIIKKTKGVGMPFISKKDLVEIIVDYPAISEQESIISKLNKISNEAKKLESIYKQKLADFEELKKSILKKAFNGEL